MFQGRTFKIRHLSKNRYEFVDAYTVTYGTATELLSALTEQQQRAQRTAVELALAKQQIKQRAREEGVLEQIPEPEKERPASVALKEQQAAAPASASGASSPRPKAHAVRVVVPRPRVEEVHGASDKAHRRRPNSLGYLNALKQAEQAEKLR